jgi:hypothetical protein
MSSKLEGHKIIIFFALAGIIIAMAIVLFIKKCCTVSVKEGFDSSPVLTSCPGSSKSYYDKNSNLMCCNGTVNGQECEGSVVCTFSTNTEKYSSCRVVIQEEQNARAALNAQNVKLETEDCLAKCRKNA